MDLEGLVRLQNRFMIGFDLILGSATLVAPRATLRFFGHEEPSPEVIAGFRRLSWVWLTFSAAHANAERRGEAPRCSPTRSGRRPRDGADPAAAPRSGSRASPTQR